MVKHKDEYYLSICTHLNEYDYILFNKKLIMMKKNTYIHLFPLIKYLKY